MRALPSAPREQGEPGEQQSQPDVLRILAWHPAEEPPTREDASALTDHDQAHGMRGAIDLAAAIRRAWVGRITSHDAGMAQAIEQQLELLFHELAGEEPTALESLLCQEVIANWLPLQYLRLALVPTATPPSTAQQNHLQQRLDVAQRRYFRAVQRLAGIRRILKMRRPPARKSAKGSGAADS